MAYALNDIYTFYCTTTSTPLDKKVFKDIVTTFNMKMMDYILDGGYMFMGNGCSYIRVVKVENRYKGDMVDWGATRKYEKETGKKVLIYFTDKNIFKFHWAKKYVFIKNSNVYKFRATRGDCGNKTRLKELLKKDGPELAKFLMK